MPRGKKKQSPDMEKEITSEMLEELSNNKGEDTEEKKDDK